MAKQNRVSVLLYIWLALYLSFGLCGDQVFRNDDRKRQFDQFALDEILKAVYPFDKSELKYVIDGTVDKKILTQNDLGSYGCLKPETSPQFMNMVRKYSHCELAVLEANPSADRYGCHEKGGNKCDLTISAKVSFTEQASAGWKVGAKIKIQDLEISTEYGESWSTSKQTEDQIQQKITLNPGQSAVPYVIVGGVRCFAEMHGVESSLIGKLTGKGSHYEKEDISCPKCDLSCADFLDGSINNDFSRYKVPRECIYYKPTKTIYPITRDPVVPCRTDKPPFFKGNMTMPLYDKNGHIVKVHIVYITEAKDVKN